MLQCCGNPAAVSRGRLLADSVGEEILHGIIEGYLDLLGTSSALHEKNGDSVLGVLSSEWCRHLAGCSGDHYQAAGKCEALDSACPQCREQCRRASLLAVETREPVDTECPGGIRIYALPIFAGAEAVGSISFGYGDPPSDTQKLQEIAARYGMTVDALRVLGQHYESRPLVAIEVAKRRLLTSARLIGALVERKLAEDALHIREAQLAQAQRTARLGAWEWDLATGNVFWSDELYRLLDFDPHEVKPDMDTLLQRVQPEDREQIRRLPHDIVQSRTSSAYQFRVVRRDASIRILHGEAELMLDENGAPLRVLGTVQDITEHKRLEQQRLNQQKIESIGSLAAGVAHDFNNLLAAITGYASLARETVAVDHVARPMLDTIIDSSARAADLTRQLLTYAGKDHRAARHVNLADMLPEMIEHLRPSIPEPVELRLQVPAGIPTIRADPAQLRQVVTNLVKNAVEAIGPGERGLVSIRISRLEVDAQTARNRFAEQQAGPGQYVCLEVSDTGCGMDQPTRTKMFDPFFSTKFLGRGLGLAAVSGIVRSHGGAVLVDSSPGAGSTLRVFLEADGNPPQAPSRNQDADSEGSGTVLVIDDEAVVGRLAKCLLERHGYAVLLASTGAEAISLLRQNGERIRAVLLDWTMPGMHGAELLAELRKIRPDVKVAVTSGYERSHVMHSFASQGVAAFLQKPYGNQRLAEVIRDVMGS